MTSVWTAEVWTESKPGQYVAEASSLRDGSDTPCPRCDGSVRPEEATEYRKGGEITHWFLRHPCGAELTVYND